MTVKKSDPHTTDLLGDILPRNGVVIIPCDTVYGIVGAAPDTEQRIRTIKKRESRPFLQLCSGIRQIDDLYGIVPDKRITSLWPGPLTVVLGLPAGGTVAVRVPDDPWLRELIERAKKSLFSTSVNFSGEEVLWRIAEIRKHFENLVDCIVDNGDMPEGKPSTILDTTSTPYRVLRHGACQIPSTLLD